ncbi:hypothetical protein PHLCEN_2v12271 [Hermanssonia centrifuga]|uniref:DUF6532 domain-containing protein n=1 Tax=Hermanssonia centrifuga TaxID=98765 RepID=A0A2R6NHJ1_9APHY|nr:hypothetical protein PHLCEN_2v12271 [Hermanssonia centrifuga]
MPSTRASNANTHPGEVVLKGQRTRRSAAEMKAVREAEVLEKAEKEKAERTREEIIKAIAKLEAEEAQKRRTKVPPSLQGLVVKGKSGVQQGGSSKDKGNGGSTKSPKTPLKRATTSGEDSSPSVKKARTTAAKLTRANVELIRSSENEESPTLQSRGGKGKQMKLSSQVLVPVKTQQTALGTKAASSSSKGPAKAIGGFLQGYDPSKAKAAQKTKISVAKKKVLDDPIEDIEMEDFDEEGDEERLSDSDASDKEEEEEERSIIVIGSSDTEGTDGGDEVNNRDRYFISERQSSEVGSPLGVEGDVKPMLRRPTAGKRKWTRFDLPFRVEDHKQYRDDFIRWVVRVMGEHPVTFNQNSVKMESLMQAEWGKTFPDMYFEFERHTPLFDITQQKIWDWRSDIGSLAYDHVGEEFKTTLKDLTEEERAEYVTALLKKGNQLPFIYARTEKMPDGTTELIGAFQGPLILKGLAAHLKQVSLPGEKLLDTVKPVGALALIATAVERAFTASKSGSVNYKHSWFSEYNWGDTSMRYLKAVRQLDDPTWKRIIQRAKQYLPQVGKPSEFATLNTLPEEEVDNYTIVEKRDELWKDPGSDNDEENVEAENMQVEA